MSGDVPVVALAGGGGVADLVRATRTVVAHAGVDVAVIGGLAVAARLATIHRATGDVDLVTDDHVDAVTTTGATAADNLVAAAVAKRDTAAPPDQVRLRVGETKVEMMVGDALRRLVLEQATRTRRWVTSSGDAQWAVVMTESSMADVAAPVLGRLAEAERP